MSERRYEVTMDVNTSRITVNVFIAGIATKEQLKEGAVKRGIEFMQELFGETITKDDITFIGYRDCGLFGWAGIN